MKDHSSQIRGISITRRLLRLTSRRRRGATLLAQGVATHTAKPLARPGAVRAAIHSLASSMSPRRPGCSAPSSTARIEPKKYILETIGCGCAFFDYDNDGWMDIFLLTARASKAIPQGATNRLYKNNRDGTFTDVTEKAGLGARRLGIRRLRRRLQQRRLRRHLLHLLGPERPVPQQRRRHLHRRDQGRGAARTRSHDGAPAAASSTTTATATWTCSSRNYMRFDLRARARARREHATATGRASR